MNEVMLFAEVELELTGYAAVGASESTLQSTQSPWQPIARDGWGDAWIPPSSLAGSFRAHLGEAAAELMGEEPEDKNEKNAKGGRASCIRFLGTELTVPGHNLPLRGQTAIDRRRAAAGATLLRNKEYLPPGTRLLCRLRVDGAAHHEPVLTALRTWRPVIGGGRSTGHGTTRTRSIAYSTLDLGTAEGRRTWLTRGGPELFAKTHTLQPEVVEQRPLIRAHWELAEALHIGGGSKAHSTGAGADDQCPEADGADRSAEPACLLRDHRRRPYIPGSTWKGILRGRCAYILDSLGLLPDCDGGCGTCALCTAFGWAGDDTDEGETVGARSRLRFTDSPVTEPRIAVRNHVALDRTTGGAAPGLLFSEEVVESGRLTLEVYAEADIPEDVLAALHLALYDLHTGAVGIGGGTTRGQGTLRCVNAADLEAQRVLATLRLGRRVQSVPSQEGAAAP